MNIFDFTNIRRAYIMHKACKAVGIHYRFHLYSGRKSIVQDPSQIAEMQKYASFVLDDAVQLNEVESTINSSDVILINSFVHSKDTDTEFQRLLNNFRGKIINIDYAWDTYKQKIPIENNRFKAKYSGIAIAVEHTSSWIKPVFKFSQPELDMSANREEFPGLSHAEPAGYDGVFLLTPGRNFMNTEILPKCIKAIRRSCSRPFIYLKFKNKDSAETISFGRRILRRLGVDHLITDESHKGFVNYCVLYALQSHAHINLDPQSFSNLEVMRCGVPTFEFDIERGLTLPKYYRVALSEFWTKSSIQDIYDKIDLACKKRAELKVDSLHCANNLIRHLKEIVHG